MPKGRIQARIRYGTKDALQLLTSQIDVGMSGAPLWDAQGRRVIWMVNAFRETRRYQDPWLALAIPVETLWAVCPLLSLPDLCPYQGMELFTEAEPSSFSGGRGGRVNDERLRREPRFLAVLGPSGSGKSPLVQAGLILRPHWGAVPGSDCWAFTLICPARNPFGELEARGLVDRLNSRPEAERLALGVDSPEAARRDFVAGLADLLDSPLPVRSSW